MNKKLGLLTSFIAIAAIAAYFYVSSAPPLFNFSRPPTKEVEGDVDPQVLAKFNFLSQNGNSSCSAVFKDSIASMDDRARLQGSCCSPMSLHRYREQIERLKKFKSVVNQNISKIPDDPYDIPAGLAKELMPHYDLELTPDEQKTYDFAMQNSDEKGPCCCKCWRWNTYGGLAKYLIRNYKFTGEQITELWNLSDGCGGDEDHHH